MNALAPYQPTQTATIESREVASMLDKRHDHLLRDIENYVRHMEESNAPKFGVVDFFTESAYQDAKGENRKCYLVTRKGCEFIANKLTGQKGTLFTAAYITRFHAMEDALHVPRSLPEALRLAADLADKNVILTQQAIQDQPKVLFADAVAASRNAILVSVLAKILRQNGIKNMGQNQLFAWLRDHGYLIRRRGSDYNMPSQYSMEMGLFEVRESYYTNRDGGKTTSYTPVVTGKGQQYFINMFLRNNRHG